MAIPRIGGSGLPLNLTGALGSQLPNPPPAGSFTLTPGAANAVTLQAGQFLVLPAGTFAILPGPYTHLQFLDPVQNQFRNFYAASNSDLMRVDSDGSNIRLANMTGCPVGALVTNAGTGYTAGIGTTATGCTVTVSAGASTWVPVVGGANNATVAITAGGSGYLFPPTIVCSAPPVGGIQMTATCTISVGAINAVTVTNQGAGYTTPAVLTLYNDSRDAVGTGGVLTAGALVGGTGLTALYPSGPGTPLTSLPTFTFAPASTTAATVVMDWVVTGFTLGATTSGTGYGNAQPFLILSQGGIVSGTRAANQAGPIADTGLTQPRMAMIAGTGVAGGKATTIGSVVVDSGYGFQAVPNLVVIAGGTGIPTTAALATAAVGGITDTSYVQPY